MKNFITVILSIFITIILILLGISISSKKMITETATLFIQEEITNKIIETTTESNPNINKEEIKEKVNRILTENPKIKNFVDSSFDKFMGILNDEIAIQDINIESEIEDLIKTATPLLNEYGITITPEMKNEIMSYVKTNEANNVINETITEIKTNMPKNIDVMITTFSNLVSMKFKMILIFLIIIFLIIIAFLKKSYYKWTLNLSMPSIIVGVFFISLGFLINKILETEEIIINMNSLKNYGIINLIIGVFLLITYIVLNKVLKKKTIEELQA